MIAGCRMARHSSVTPLGTVSPLNCPVGWLVTILCPQEMVACREKVETELWLRCPLILASARPHRRRKFCKSTSWHQVPSWQRLSSPQVAGQRRSQTSNHDLPFPPPTQDSNGSCPCHCSHTQQKTQGTKGLSFSPLSPSAVWQDFIFPCSQGWDG